MYSDDYFSLEITLLTVPGNTNYSDFCMTKTSFFNFFKHKYYGGFAIMLRKKPGYLFSSSGNDSKGLGYENMDNGVVIEIDLVKNYELGDYSDQTMSIKDCFINGCSIYENEDSSQTILKNYVSFLIKSNLLYFLIDS